MQHTKLKGVPSYECVKPPEGYGLYTRKGRKWREDLGLESICCYLRVMAREDKVQQAQHRW